MLQYLKKSIFTVFLGDFKLIRFLFKIDIREEGVGGVNELGTFFSRG